MPIVFDCTISKKYMSMYKSQNVTAGGPAYYVLHPQKYIISWPSCTVLMLISILVLSIVARMLVHDTKINNMELDSFHWIPTDFFSPICIHTYIFISVIRQV